MSLTASQTLKHWRCWKQVAAANHWVMVRQRLHPQARATAERSLQHEDVWTVAGRLALAKHREPTNEDLRKACYVVTTDHLRQFRKSTVVTDSSKKLDNAGFSHLLSLWGDEDTKAGLLIEPECLTSLTAWEHPENDLVAALDTMLAKAAPDGRLRAITFNATHGDTREWQSQNTDFKRWLLKTVRGEQKKWNKPVGEPALAGIETNPF